MTPDQITAFGAAIAVVIAALGALWFKLRSLNHHLNSRLDLLIDTVEKKAYAEGGADERERASGEEKPATRSPKGHKDKPA